MSYPEEYRKRTIEYRQEGHTLEETKEVFKVSISTIRAWENQMRKEGNWKAKRPNRSFKKIDPEKLKAYVKEHPDAYQSEIAKEFNCTPEAIRKAFQRLKITRKKKAICYKEQRKEKVKGYLEQIVTIPFENIAYVDETGIDTYLCREYGYAPRGKTIYGIVSGRNYKRIGIVAAKLNKKIVAPLVYSGTMDSTLFEKWFQQQLLPTLPKETVIVMDNAAFHRKKQLFSIAEENGYRLIFLPPYSPEWNPIEKFWSWLKYHLKKFFHILTPSMTLYLSVFKLFNYSTKSHPCERFQEPI